MYTENANCDNIGDNSDDEENLDAGMAMQDHPDYHGRGWQLSSAQSQPGGVLVEEVTDEDASDAGPFEKPAAAVWEEISAASTAAELESAAVEDLGPQWYAS